jgi:hypothetical protein
LGQTIGRSLGRSQEQQKAAQQACYGGSSRQCDPGFKPRLSGGSSHAFKAGPKINTEFGLTPNQSTSQPATKVSVCLTIRPQAKYVPFAGQVVAADVGYSAIRYLGGEYLKDCVRVARQAQLKIPLLGHQV